MSLPPITLRSGMKRISRAVVVEHATGVETEVGVPSAKVVVDAKSVAYRTVPSAAITTDVDPALMTAPNRLKLWSGFRVDGGDYLAPLAHVRLGKVERSKGGIWQVSNSQSFEALVAKARFRQPVVATGGTSMMTMLVRLIQDAVPWATIRVETSRDALFPASGQTFETERIDAVLGRAESISTALAVSVTCDGNGDFVIRDAGPSGEVWDAPSGPGGLLIDWKVESDPEAVVNVWVCHSDNRDAQVRGVAADDNPYSPTRVSLWGESVKYQASPLYTQQWQCEQAAQAFLEGSRGLEANLSFRTVPNPWQDTFTQVASTVDGQRIVNTLDRVEHGWNVGEPLQCTAAARTVSVG